MKDTVTVYVMVLDMCNYMYGTRPKALLTHEQTKKTSTSVFIPQTFSPTDVVDARVYLPSGVFIKFFNGEEWEIMQTNLEEVETFFGLNKEKTVKDRVTKLEKRRGVLTHTLNKIDIWGYPKEQKIYSKVSSLEEKNAELEQRVDEIEDRVGAINRICRR